MRSPIGSLSVPGLNVCPGLSTLPQDTAFYACHEASRSGWQLQKEFSMKRMHGLICGVIPPMRTMGTPSRFLHLSCNTVDSGASLLWKRWESVGAGRKQRYGGSSKSMGMSFLCTGCPVPMAVSCLTLSIRPEQILSFRNRIWLCVFCVKYLFAQLISAKVTEAAAPPAMVTFSGLVPEHTYFSFIEESVWPISFT